MAICLTYSMARPAIAASMPEELFLINGLAYLYGSLPSLDLPPKEIAEQLIALRSEVLINIRRLKNGELDASLLSGYKDFLDILDSYTGLLVSIEKADVVANAQRREAGVESLVGAAGSGVSVGMKLGQSGVPPQASAGIAVAVAAIELAVGSYLNEARISDERKAEIRAHSLRLRNELLAAQGEAEENAILLARRKGWPVSEVSFKLPRSDSEAALLAAGANRPRDPRRLASLCLLRNTGENIDPAPCMAAANLVPPGIAYDALRGSLGALAGDALNRKFSQELNSKPGTAFFDGRTSSTAASAVRYWSLCVDAAQDSSGECRERMAWSLAASGQRDSALSLALSVEPLRRLTVRHERNLAELASQLGKYSIAAEHLGHLLETPGFADISGLKKSPGLAPFRKARAELFRKLTEVKWSWSIEYGMMFDDIIIKNESNFTLTNVVLKPDLGWLYRNLELKTEKLEPGAVHKWANVASLNKAFTKNATASFSCDQLGE
ncbi:MAG: hypothetical protein SF066_05445 [Thermoanaerobaculia bacterium]|nr:hypothetical protein [Thermoanaerobaculia bacterium]